MALAGSNLTLWFSRLRGMRGFRATTGEPLQRRDHGVAESSNPRISEIPEDQFFPCRARLSLL
jgi:hypothetical protein